VRVTPTEIPEVLLIEPDVYRDPRGFFLETYQAERYRACGIEGTFVQDNQSRSVAGTLRGLHVQVDRPQAKLVRVIVGVVYDVAVDIRRGSPTFGKWVAVELSAANFKQCYIPPGFAHGFAVLSPEAEIEYKCTDVYDKAAEIGIAWNDPALAIQWPVERPLLSDRDQHHPTLAAQAERLPAYRPPPANPARPRPSR
jgi:dTDP-4-dehydrorhamnose 3,5-epimerase